jgi:hypothetical protein
MLAGALLLLDGCLGLRTLPPLTPHASYPNDWREIERRLYVGTPGLVRFGLAASACIILAVASASFGHGNWVPWYTVISIIAWAVVWLVASWKATRDTLANDI